MEATGRIDPALFEEDSILVLPALVSIGNVGQLAMDLLLSSIKPLKVGALYNDALVPIVGPDMANNSLMTAAEVFVKNKFVFLQLRSAIVKGYRKQWVHDIIDWVKRMGKFKEIICLSSIDAHERSDDQIKQENFRYLSTQGDDVDFFQAKSWKSLELKENFPSLPQHKTLTEFDKLHIPGGGFSKELYKQCKEEGLILHILFTFSSEGDNVPDAMRLYEYFNSWKQQAEKVVIPSSWSHLYGNRVTASVF
uniref:Proteasome assembly chaperone 2 n=2 Tax=Lepeophtheirus salmonis TaxID=72036 RepID=C1BTW0_LEPSM|nr:proteasome assembly chaperone 2-like [Lepeophtheirus salmonis]ACO12463.1 Proteasome assembly chaperone 2 [Lepeophtheirus salmonis]ADD37884.1 Proteasome assembly chaperone 2 [Lepeophtheirus salmonis]